MGFNGRGKTRVGEDSVKAKDIVIGGEVQPKVVCEGGGNNKGGDGELCRSGGNGGGWIGVLEGRGVFNGHGGEKGCFIGGLRMGILNERDEGGEGSSYTPGGVPWHGRIPTQGARSLLPWNILSNGPSTVGRAEFLCVSRFSRFRNVPHFPEDQGVEMGSSSHRWGSQDKVKGGKHGTCREYSRTVGDGVYM